MTREVKSPEQLEREIAQTRLEIDHTLDAIQEKLSAGRVFQEALTYTRESGAAFADNLGRSMRDNPVPLLLIGAGLGWLFFADGTSSDEQDAEDAPHPSAADTAAGGSGKGSSAASRFTAAVSAVEERAAGPGRQGSETAEKAGAKIEEWRDDIRHLGGEASDRAAQMRHSAAETFRRTTRQAGSSAGRFVEENPLITGALVLASGAALAALFPRSEREDQVMGEGAEKLRNTAARQAQDVKRAAKSVMKAAHEGAERGIAEAAKNDEAGEQEGSRQHEQESALKDDDAARSVGPAASSAGDLQRR